MQFDLKIIPVTVCLFFCGLALAQTADPVTPAPELNPSALNVIHSEQLRRIMLRLNELAYERENTELGLDLLRAKQVAALVAAAGSLQASAGHLPNILITGELNAAEQASFVAIARQLHDESLRLQADIHAYRFDLLPAGYRRLQRICDACHGLFRDDREFP